MRILEGQKDIYMLVRPLAENTGEAKIYVCENQKGDQFAARVYPNMEGLDNAMRRFLYQTDHPYLMRFLDHGVSEINGKKCAFEIFEYMELGTLAAGAPLEEYYVEKTVIPCISEALHALHEAGFLHRDVKPDNMYAAVDADGVPCAKLGDFGISVLMGKDGSYCDAALAFTPGYVPAEVLGTGMYSPASDYYGLAVSIYYLLTGTQIYEGLSPDEIMIKTRRGELMHYDNVSKRMASLLEGLTVQDPRYRWGYQEIKAWLAGANVPVFRYSQEEQILDPPYQLTAEIRCSSLRELVEAICQYPEEGKKHLYDGLLADSLRRQYQYQSNTLSDLTVNRFPHNRNAGLAAAVRVLDPAAEGFFWNGKRYKGLFPLIQDLEQEVVDGNLNNSAEELLTSGVLSYCYADVLSAEDIETFRFVEKEAQENVFRAACELVLGMTAKPLYHPNRETDVNNILEYICFLESNPMGLADQIYQDFNKEYFQCWLGKIGYSVAFREWRDFFYKGGQISRNGRIIGNVCQFLERICPEKRSVLRCFVIRDLEHGPEYWLKDHLDLYEMDEMMDHMVHENFESVEYTEEMSIPDLMRAQHEMKEYMHELRRDFLNNYILYRLGVYDVTDYRIVSKQKDAYFVPDANHEFVPVGWLVEIGNLQERSLIQKGLSGMKKEASDYLQALEKKIGAWSNTCQNICQERRQNRQIPGFAGGFFSLLFGVILLLLWGILSRNFLEGSGLLTKAGFVAVFLCIILCMAAGIVRLDQFRLWRRLLQSIGNLKHIAQETKELRKNLEVEASQLDQEEKIQPSGHNLEMEAQEERAYSGYLAAYRKGKNGILRYYLLFILAAVLLGSGLYMDGSISFTGGDFAAQITSMFHRDSKNKTDSDKKESKDYVVSVSSARLRAGAGTSYEVLNSYEEGTTIKLTGKTQSDGAHIWYQVETPDGTTGWMRDDTISKK